MNDDDLPLFRRLTADERAYVLSLGRIERWSAGAHLLEEGAEGPRVLVVLDGRAEVLRRDPRGEVRLLAHAGPGDVVGELRLLDAAPRSATVRALTPIRAFSVDIRVLEGEVAARHPAVLAFAWEIARALAGRVRALDDRVVRLIADGPGGAPEPPERAR